MPADDKRTQTGDLWYVMGADKVVYGPVPQKILYQWASEHRITVGSRVSVDKASWAPAESLDILKMEWTAVLSDGQQFGPFNILAVPILFQRGQLPEDSPLFNRISGKTLLVRDLVTRIPKQAASGDGADHDGLSRPPIGGSLPSAAGTPAPSPEPVAQPIPASAPTEAAPPPESIPPQVDSPPDFAPVALTPPPTEPVALPVAALPVAALPVAALPVAALPVAALPAAALPAAQRRARREPDAMLKRELERVRKELADRVIQLEDASRRAGKAEDQLRILTEKQTEREAAFKLEIELLKREFVAAQREEVAAAPAQVASAPPIQDPAHEQLRQDFAAAGSEIETLRAELVRLQSGMAAETNSQAAALEAARAEITRLSLELESGRVLQAELKDQMEKLEQERTMLDRGFRDFRDAATAKTRELTARLGGHDDTVDKLRGELADTRKHATDLKEQLVATQAETERIRDDSTRLVDAATAKTRELTARLGGHDDTVDKLRDELAETRKRAADLKEQLAATQAETERIRDDSTRLVLQHQATAQQLQRERGDLAARLQPLEANLGTVEQECRRLQASASAMGLLHRQEITALRQQLQDLQSAPAQSEFKAPPPPTPAPEIIGVPPGEVDRLKKTWDIERKDLLARLEEASEVRHPPPVRRFTWIRIAGVAVGGLVLLGIGYGWGHRQNLPSPVNDVIGSDLLAEIGDGLPTPPSALDHEPAVQQLTDAGTSSSRLPSGTSTTWPDIRATGCYVLPAETQCKILLAQGLFSASTNLAPDAMTVLGELATALSGRISEYRLVIRGHTDNMPVGADSGYPDNAGLGLARATITRDLLIDQLGLKPAAVETLSTGETDAPYPNDTEASRLLNRTVTFELHLPRP